MEQRENLMKHLGSLQQMAYIRPMVYGDGRSYGMRACEVKNGPLSYRLLADKCLDVAEFSYKGVNFNFLSKPGLQGPGHYDTNGDEALRSIMGGLLFTAGLENICAPCRENGKNYPMHGRIRTTPAEHFCTDAFWQDGRYILRASGEMREAELFGENLVLRRSIETFLGDQSVIITDCVENEAYRPEPLMLLYHINIGYPLLDEGTEFVAPTRKVTPRDADAQGHEDRWNFMDAPKDNEPEYVFIHDLVETNEGTSAVCVLNHKLELGLRIEFTRKHLPYFMQWKSTASGDYALGLEPSNSSVYGRSYHTAEGTLHTLKPFGSETNILKFTVLDGAEELRSAKAEIEALSHP